jgi:hypothetical protein
MTRRRRRRLLLILAVVSLPFLCCGGFEFLVRFPTNGTLVERLEADLNERVPLGSTWEQAEAWFASYNMQPGGIYDEANRKIGIVALISNDSFLQRAQIEIYLHFDPEGRLRERSIRRVFRY